jgi:hypothetical protein
MLNSMTNENAELEQQLQSWLSNLHAGHSQAGRQAGRQEGRQAGRKAGATQCLQSEQLEADRGAAQSARLAQTALPNQPDHLAVFSKVSAVLVDPIKGRGVEPAMEQPAEWASCCWQHCCR